jgi:hypothetical protein
MHQGPCNYCHVEGDRASDEKMQKVIARNMILMVREINSLLRCLGDKSTGTWTEP